MMITPSWHLDRPPDGDIADEDDVATLVREFYAACFADELLAPIFRDMVLDHLTDHLALLVDFWMLQLFGERRYRSNTLAAHERVNLRHPLTEAHFERWLDLFATIVDDNWSGPRAEDAKRRSRAIMRGISMRVERTAVEGSPLPA